MSASPTPPLAPLSGLLTAQVRYAARLAHGMDARLGLGALTTISTTGSRHLAARVSVDGGGELRLHGGVAPTPDAPPTPVVPLVSVGAGTDAATEAALAKVHGLSGLRWGALVRAADRTVVASVGTPVARTLPDVAVRALGILTGLDEAHGDDCVWMTYEELTLAVAPLAGGCLVLCLGAYESGAVLATLHAVRLTLAPVDLARVAPLTTPYRPPVAHDLTDEFGGVDDVEWEEWVGPEVPLTGARFAGAPGSADAGRRARSGRWFRRDRAS